MSILPTNIVVLLLIILVPIAPAFLFFKLLPSNAVVQGPFQGLKINLGGAFGGYFLLFITLLGIHGSFEGTSYEKWTVKGQIIEPGAAPTEYLDPRYITFSVPSIKSDSDGNFSLKFLRTSDGEYDYPYLYINVPGYVPVTYFLGPKDRNVRHEKEPMGVDPKAKVIDLGQVNLVRQPPQDAQAASSNANPLQAVPTP